MTALDTALVGLFLLLVVAGFTFATVRGRDLDRQIAKSLAHEREIALEQERLKAEQAAADAIRPVWNVETLQHTFADKPERVVVSGGQQAAYAGTTFAQPLSRYTSQDGPIGKVYFHSSYSTKQDLTVGGVTDVRYGPEAVVIIETADEDEQRVRLTERY